LEPRLLLDGNVVATVSGHNLTIRSYGSASSEIEITKVGEGSYLITGVDGTTVNGEAAAEVDGVTRNVKFDMRGGSDSVTLDGLDITGNLNATLGRGSDGGGLTVTNGTVGGKMVVKGGGGGDDVTLDNVAVDDYLVVVLGRGNDSLTLVDVAARRAQYNGGGGSDLIQMSPGDSWDGVPQRNFELFNLGPSIANQTFSVNENSGNGTSVGTAVATDPDLGDSLTYAITAGNTGTTFAINSATGGITVNNNTLLDFETHPTFSLTVSVTDTGLLSDTATITVNLNNVAEGP
jgi:hypothetical protein